MPDKHEVGGSSPLEPTKSAMPTAVQKKRRAMEYGGNRKIIENRIQILKRTDNFFKILKSGFSEKEIG